MSTLPDNEFDLEKLFLPAWAQQEPSSAKYAKFEGEEQRPDRRDERRGPRPPRREGRPAGRPEGPGARGERRGPPGPEGGRARSFRGDRNEPGDRSRGHRPEMRERREPPPPLVEVEVSLVPEERGVESLARQIKMTGRAYPLFDIAQMILQKPERHVMVFSIRKNAEGQPIQPLFVCALDDTLWLSEDEAVAHVLKRHFTTFYQPEKTATEPPKGKYTFVAQCGMSGVILGPPNHHDYQNQLRKLHGERYSRMPFEVYKSRVRIVRDEEVVKKWVEDQSWKTEYVCLNLPEPLRLAGMEAVEKHFRENHKDNIIKPAESHTLNGTAARALRSPELGRLVRSVWEDQRRFPLQIATVLSQQFATHGLQFFKVNKTITHVSVARPHFLDLSLTPVSEGVKRIVDYITANAKCTRRKLVEALAPSPAVIPVSPPVEPAAAGEEKPAAAAAPAAPEPTAEQTAINADLHWLIHQGHVIEFANGVLETAKRPALKPPKPEVKPREKPAEPPPLEAISPPGATGAEPEVAPAALPEAAPDSQVAEPVRPEEGTGADSQGAIKASEAISGDGKATIAPEAPGASAPAVPTDQSAVEFPAAPVASP